MYCCISDITDDVYCLAPLTQQIPFGARCCDNCEPARFPVELVEVEKILGLKGGKKRKFPTELSDAIRTGLRAWSRNFLMPLLYPKEAGFSITGSALLPDLTIEQLAMCGERVASVATLSRRARWDLMEDHGEQLLAELQRIFTAFDLLLPPDCLDDNEQNDTRDIFDIILDGPSAPRSRGRGGRRGSTALPTTARGIRGVRGSAPTRSAGRGVRGTTTRAVRAPSRRAGRARSRG